MRRFRIVAGLVCVLALPAFGADDLFAGAPPVPPGYTDYKDAQQAVLTGKMPMVKLDTAVPEGVAFHDNLEYAKPGDTSLTLDLYVPKASKSAPLLVFVHGGGWSGGKKEDLAFYAIDLAKSGYATATIQYRLSPKFHFPAAIQDVRCALGWLEANSPQYGFDGSRMVLIGGSAGGHLVLLAGYTSDPQLDSPDGPKVSKGAIKGIVNFYGVVDCTTPVAQAAKQVNDFIGAPYSEAADMYALSSPNRHLDAGDPPTLTFHGTIDELVPVSQADELHETLNKLGIPNYYDRVEGWPHTMDLAQPLNDRFRFVMRRFLAIYLPLEP